MPYFTCLRQITSNSTYLEAKQVEIYLEVDNASFFLFEAICVEFYLFGGRTRRNLPTGR